MLEIIGQDHDMTLNDSSPELLGAEGDQQELSTIKARQAIEEATNSLERAEELRAKMKNTDNIQAGDDLINTRKAELATLLEKYGGGETSH